MARKKKGSVEGQLTVEMKPTGAPVRMFRVRANAVFTATDAADAARKLGKHVQALGSSVCSPSTLKDIFEDGSLTIEPCKQRKLHILQPKNQSDDKHEV